MGRKCLYFVVLVGLVVPLAGCVHAARDTTGFAITDEGTVDLSFDKAWQATKAVLREEDLDLYTRDKRGVFVAFTKMKRNLFLVPHRIQYTIALESVSEEVTRVSIESLKQVYGVTLLTYPGWHDRKTEDHTQALALLEAIQAKAG